MIARCSKAWASTAVRCDRLRRSFCGAPAAKPLPEMKFRAGRAVAGEVKSQMSAYSNISPNILELVDRQLYKQEGHPVCTLADR